MEELLKTIKGNLVYLLKNKPEDNLDLYNKVIKELQDDLEYVLNLHKKYSVKLGE